MKILHFLYELVSGGAERFVVDLANAQYAAGNEVTICILRPLNERSGFNRQFLVPGVGFESLGIGSGITPGKMAAVRKYIESADPDILHCHHNILPYLALTVFRKKKPVIVHTVHSAAERANKNKAERAFCKFLYRHGMVTPVTISQECRRSFLRVYSTDAECIYNGRSFMAPSGNEASVRSEIDSYKRSGSSLVFVHVGRCHLVKNQQLLVEAFNRLDRDGVDFVLIVIGAAFDSPAGQELQRIASPNIHFVGEKDNVADYLMNADAFCLTSKSEGLSISLLEALQCGVTPICTPVGGNTDVVSDGETGYLSSDLSLESYVDALCRYLNNPIDREELKRYFRKHFSMDACAAGYNTLYRKLLNK